jgi:cardiolipin synthase
MDDKNQIVEQIANETPEKNKFHGKDAKSLKQQLLSIPNILCYIRVALIPVIMYFTIATNTHTAVNGGQFHFPFIALGLLAFAAFTDLLDGWIARKFNMTTDAGKILDPLADKLMHSLTILALVVAGFIHHAFFVVLLFKEFVMVIGGMFLFNQAKLIQANILGKIASVILSIAVMMAFFHSFFKTVYFPHWIVLGIGLLVTYVAFAQYLKQALAIAKKAQQDRD